MKTATFMDRTRTLLFYAIKMGILYPLYCRAKKLIDSPLHLPYTAEGQAASDAIYDALISGKPCMVCRYGGTEIRLVAGYLNATELNACQRLWKRLCFQHVGFSRKMKWMMHTGANFFPPTDENFTRFAQLMLEDSRQIDILGVWRPEEVRVTKHPERVTSVPLFDLDPYRHNNPWSRALAGKKVLVVHPFVETIRRQYAKRELLFANLDVLPEFQLINYRPLFKSLPGNPDYFPSWFDALDYMKAGISAITFDIAIIGAGPYGFPLAAHVKRMGKQSLHLGGQCQVLFGIKGKRYDNMECYHRFYNEHWCRPSASETPTNAQKIEHGCYW